MALNLSGKSIIIPNIFKMLERIKNPPYSVHRFSPVDMVIVLLSRSAYAAMAKVNLNFSLTLIRRLFLLAKGKFVSLFICICRGDYDTLLVWPFSHRVTFTLLDQGDDIDNRRHIVYSVKPNTCKENKPFLGRPITDRNASFGAQKFTDLDTMGTLEYIKDDTIYIKVEIDTEDMNII